MNNSLPWWQNGVIYQIYPKSFQDTTGNGTGDLRGIIRRLDYLKLLGVDAIWLTPIYLSPQVDNGYDISDYYAIDERYGSMADFEELVVQVHKRGIRLILDMVLNHTSTQHPWFIASVDKQSPYHQFYFWRDANEDGTPPNNWLSKFGGKSWQWCAENGQYYLHLFAVEQADLNWQHLPVREELKKICEFWVDKGVDGLRLDVINLISKPEQFTKDQQGDGREFYTDGSNIHSYLQEFSRDIFTPRNLMTVGEMSSTTLEHCQQYSRLDGKELSMVFNFHHLKVDYPDGNKWTYAKPDFIELKKIFNHWQQGMYQKGWNALFWCNHDQPRIVSRFGDEHQYRVQSAKMLAMVLHGLQGTPYIYQGEEIGMTNPNFDNIHDYRDIESLNAWQHLKDEGISEQKILAILSQKSRDNSRTPMQWDSSPNAGFTSGTPWIKTASNYATINTQQAIEDENSIFYCYKQLIALRKQLPVLTLGSYQDLEPNHPWLWCYLRQWDNTHLYVITNLSAEKQQYSLPLNIDPSTTSILLSNCHREELNTELMLSPYEALFLLTTEVKK